MRIPLLQGAYADSSAAYHTSYPINLEPTLVSSGLSEGYLTNTPGVTQIAVGPGQDRGGINWQNVCYRVMDSKLVRADLDGTVTILGDVGTDGLPVSMDYSFDRLGIASNGNLFYYCTPSGPDPGVTQVTDPNLGVCLDVQWIDGYWMSTDGEFLVVTELNDPYTVDPLKYGSSESDPDPVVALAKVRGQVYALNRDTIQNFQDIGGLGFPFSNNPAGLIPRGVVGTHTWSYFLETFAFVGSARNEQVSVYLAGSGDSVCISTSEIDRLLADFPLATQAQFVMESRVDEGEQRLYVHLPDKTLVYMHQASLQNKSPVWHILRDGALMDQYYSPRFMVQLLDTWMVGDPFGRLGYLDATVATRWGEVVGWQFDTQFLYNSGHGGIVQSVELVGLPGRPPFGVEPTVALSWTFDGQLWSQERFISMGAFGERQKRIQWRPKFRFRNYVGLRFRSATSSVTSWAALEAQIEALSV
jgi:hypothetical protein